MLLSSKNTQPWEVSIITNKTKDQLVKIMCEKFDKDEFEDPDYNYSLDPLPDEFKARARACGLRIIQTKKD